MHLAGLRPLAGPYAGVYGQVLKSLLVGGNDDLLLFSWPSAATLFSQLSSLVRAPSLGTQGFWSGLGRPDCYM